VGGLGLPGSRRGWGPVRAGGGVGGGGGGGGGMDIWPFNQYCELLELLVLMYVPVLHTWHLLTFRERIIVRF